MKVEPFLGGPSKCVHTHTESILNGHFSGQNIHQISRELILYIFFFRPEMLVPVDFERGRQNQEIDDKKIPTVSFWHFFFFFAVPWRRWCVTFQALIQLT